ncbi:MAG: helix-turn-helix domain-containing protein [Treponemataceae bacterium]|nr:helix-turn-helix domain-containing protein [Treponemataceae bacterium]
MSFRSRLREEIAFSGLSNKEVAAKAEITKRALDSYVSSQSCMPSADVAVRLAKALHTSVEYLVTGETDSAQPATSKENERQLLRIYSSLPTSQRNLLLSVANDIQRCLGTARNVADSETARL